MSEGFVCCAAGLEEYPAAAALRQEMALEMGNDFDGKAADWRAKFGAYFGGKQSSGNAQLFLAYDGATPAGCVLVSLEESYRRYCFGTLVAHVNAVFVRPEYRRRGIATALVQMAIAWARDKGCARVRLRTSEDGRRLYETLGFSAGREMELPL